MTAFVITIIYSVYVLLPGYQSYEWYVADHIYL